VGVREVARLADDDDHPSQPGGTAGATVARQPKPGNGQGGAARRPEEIERR
jgi:hypothetical protein